MADSTSKVRSTKLTFKGDKKGKKRKRKEKDVGGHGSGGEGSDAEGADPQAWVYPSNPLQVLGPTFIVHPTSPQSPTCITYEQTRARIVLHSLSTEEEDGGMASIVPTEVNQVWVVTRIAGSATINLRTPDGKFMSCDQHGVVSSDREARGPQEEWTPIILPDAPGMVAFQNYYSKYLSVDETAGGTMSLRGDSEEVGFNERFFVKVQAEYKRKAGEEERKRKKVESVENIDEAGTNKKFQAWGAGRSVVSDADRKDLKKARKEGNLSEAMLDRRAKLKRDFLYFSCPDIKVLDYLRITSPSNPSLSRYLINAGPDATETQQPPFYFYYGNHNWRLLHLLAHNTTTTTTPFTTTIMVLEIVAAVGGSIAFAKYLAPILYHECFAPTSDDELLNAGLFPSERSPLMTPQYPSPSPRAESLRLAAELYNGHLEDWVSRQRASNSGGSTPAAITDASGATTPLSVSPSTPASAASSYFDLRQPPLYINDVQVALERETKRRNSNDFPRANVLAGFHMAHTSGTDTPTSTNDGLTMAKRPSLARRFSNQTTVSSAGKSRTFSEDTAWLTSSLVCLLHSPDLSQFFLSGEYLDEDVDSKYHRAVIDAFASTAQFFWPSAGQAPLSAPSLDLSVFQAILKRTTPSATAAPTPLSSSPVSRPASPPLSSSPVSTNATLVNPSASPSNLTGAQAVSHLLRSLHIALNEGEYTSDQPTYLRSPYQLSAFDDEGFDEGLRRHAGFLRNMQNIQEDSIVRDVFEGLVCVKTLCGGEGCEENTARFEGFSVLPLTALPKREGNKKPSLSALLKAYEKPTVQEKQQYCRACQQYTQHTETRKIWNLPSTIIFQLPSTTTSQNSTASPSSTGGSSASSSRTNSPPTMARRLSRSHSVSLPGSAFGGGLAGMTPLSTQVPVDYPVESLDLGKFHGEARSSFTSSSTSHRSSSTSSLPYDLSSESGEDEFADDELTASRPSLNPEDEEEMYDLFAVRECVKENRYRVYAKDPVVEGQGKWAMFDAATGVSREVKDLREVVTPNADLLFYRRREEA